jgi:hypothetical protein
MQVQLHGGLGGRTVPFHLVSAIVRTDGQPSVYQLVAEVAEGAAVQRAEEDRLLAGALQLPVGRTLRYRFTDFRGGISERLMCISVTLFGQFRLTTDNGASAAFEQRGGTLGCYDRQGPADSLLDLWLLAMGLTPLSTLAECWEDSPSAAILPVAWPVRIWAGLCRPLGAGVVSRFKRNRSDDDRCWVQTGSHELRLPGIVRRAQTSAMISPESGCLKLQIELDGRRMCAELLAIGQVADRGVPAWEHAVAAGIHDPVSAEASAT